MNRQIGNTFCHKQMLYILGNWLIESNFNLCMYLDKVCYRHTSYKLLNQPSFLVVHRPMMEV